MRQRQHPDPGTARAECLDENQLVALFDGTEQDPAVHAHLDICPDCRRVVAELARELAAEEEADFARQGGAAHRDDGLVSGEFDGRATWRGAIVGGRYRLLRFLGEGGLGIVWSAADQGGPDTAREAFALKFLKATEAARAKRFVREGRVTAALRHPNIVHVHDAFEAEGFPPVIVMDLLQGETLRACMRRVGRIELAPTITVLRSIVSALGEAHARGVVHRDLKPDNVFLSETQAGGRIVKVLDFGLAKLTALEGGFAATSPLTNSGHIVGTPTYMAPEQIFGEKDIDARADIWSLGVLAFECLSARRPVEGRTLGHALRAISTGKLTPLSEVAPDLPPAMTGLVMQMLSIDRSRRPSLYEIWEQLGAIGRYGGGSLDLG
ncbi:serine/threonine-protein kinase [Pendulispora albinea]|uniref:Serine/threonine protein kinase n=1 Tax=Pendulispora albinea TaxID=2741071 RepID=A0ABZ2MC50_9BACT